MVPGRRQLAAQHGVALTTLERAVATLTDEGLLRTEDRRGTFVTQPDGSGGHAASGVQSGARPDGSSGHAAFRVQSGAWPGGDPLVATVGIVVGLVPYPARRTYESQWPVQVLEACEHQLACEPGVTMRVLNVVTPGPTHRPLPEAVDQLLSEGVDAVIVIGERVEPAFVARHAGMAIPLVFAAYDRAAHPFPQVYADDVAAGQLAAGHLLERGYRRLAYFRPFAADWATERLEGIRSVLGAGAEASPLKVLPAEPEAALELAPGQRAAAYRHARRELADPGWLHGTGVIASNDAMAEGFVEAVQELGLTAGRDYAIVGFDDRARETGLTSLRPPLTELGEEVAHLALRMLRGGAAPTRIALRHRLIARSSTAPRVAGSAQKE
jgi:DNA-binding LacI/PurR family transcriptional regulator